MLINLPIFTSQSLKSLVPRVPTLLQPNPYESIPKGGRQFYGSTYTWVNILPNAQGGKFSFLRQILQDKDFMDTKRAEKWPFYTFFLTKSD